MPRVRSPNYPAISLAEAIERVAMVFEKERTHPMDREVVLKALGYKGAHGPSLSALSAARKYGLLSHEKGVYRVTERAIAILHPESTEEKIAAINEAAREPSLFAELLGYFKGSIPSDDNLRSYLVRKGFSTTALGGVIQSFRETMQLVTSGGDLELSLEPHTDRSIALEAVGLSLGGARAAPPLPPLSSGEPFRVSFTGSGIEVSARLTDMASADSLIKSINALKLLLQPATAIKKPNEEDDLEN